VDFENGKKAVTEYEILGETDGHARVALHPKTGRTHQLRVHCAHLKGLNNPVLGDNLYGNMPSRRLFLHAESIRFHHPITGEEMQFSIPPEF
jgi:tRNA pseudouridine32 synthase/23S rRNA pseudouridine746 synthase